MIATNETMDEPTMFDVPALAKRLNVSEKFVRKPVEDRRLPG
jgi:hypothetical protein